MISKKIKLFIFTLFIFININLVFSNVVIQEYNITNEDLPFIFEENFLIQLQENETLYINEGNLSNEFINLNYISNYTFNLNESNYTLQIFGFIDDFFVSENQTIEKNIFLNNSLNNITTEIIFRANIEYIIPNFTGIINDSETYSVDILDDGYNITISSNTLPKSGMLEFELSGFPNQEGSVSYCGDFLICPNNFKFDDEGKHILKISYLIPFGQLEGTYTRVIAIQSNGTFRQSRVIFNIIKPQYVVEYYVYRDECFLNRETMIACIREQQEFDTKRLSEFINFIMKEDYVCPTVNETIRYVMQGEINQSMKMLYDNSIRDLEKSRNEIILLREQMRELQLENSKLMSEKDIIQSDTNKLIKQSQDEAFSVKISSEMSIKEMEEDLKRQKRFWFWFSFYSIIFILFSSYIYYVYKKDNWM